MKDFTFPLVSVITVNYNGIRFLKDLFNSIRDLNYPADKIMTIMVDNCSTDGSPEFVNKNFPWVKIISTDKNLGYAGGNNAGIKAAKGKYVALINNDCVVDRNWLLKLVEAAEKGGSPNEKADGLKTGSVSSKVLFNYSYIPLVIKTGKGDLYISDINIEKTSLSQDKNCTSAKNPETLKNIQQASTDLLKSIKFLSGCKCIYRDNDKGSSKWLISEYALIAIPVENPCCATTVKMTVNHSYGKSEIGFYLKRLGEIKTGVAKEKTMNQEALIPLAEVKIEKENFHVEFTINPDMYIYKADIINSCGIEVNRSFYSRDRGGNTFDLGQYSSTQEVFGPCGSSLLASRLMLEETGIFDDMFFTYYEDVDLFWRARLKGWKSIYAPGSVARHHHCGSNVEWSYSFTYHVLRNRLLAIFRCAWPSAFIKNCLFFVISAFVHTAFYFAARIRGRKQDRPDIRARVRIVFELFWLLPRQLASRIKIRYGRKIPDLEIKKILADF